MWTGDHRDSGSSAVLQRQSRRDGGQRGARAGEPRCPPRPPT